MSLKMLSPFLSVLLGALITCLVAFLNGYPLVYPDTGEYLNSGFEAVPPYDRTIFYGLFARHISLFFSLWLVVLAQGLLISYLLYRCFDLFISSQNKDLFFLLTIAALTLTTGLSYNVSIIMPDIFSAISILCLALLLLHDKPGKYELGFISLVFVYSIATQVSSFLILACVMLVLLLHLLIRKIRRKGSFLSARRLLLSIALYVTSLVLVPTVHVLLGGRFTLSNGGHVFLMNHFLETGILKSYLDDNCPSPDHKICAFKDSLGSNLMWEINGPLYRTGGWEANKGEYDKIIRDIVTDSRYAGRVLSTTLEYSTRQLLTYDITVAGPQLGGTAPWGQIYWRFRSEIPAYMASSQSRGTLNLDLANRVHSILIPLSLAVLAGSLIVLHYKKLLSARLKWIFALVLMYWLSSAMICANFSTIDARFENRVVWLFPLLAVIAIADLVKTKKAR